MLKAKAEFPFFPADGRISLYREIEQERIRQGELKAAGKFPFTCADSQLRQAEKLGVLAEEFGEVAQLVCRVMIPAPGDQGVACISTTELEDYRKKLKEELIQVAAVCVAWAESL
jgi:NTP pyrophosphatase (non-canonical NTP hydrolase)